MRAEALRGGTDRDDFAVGGRIFRLEHPGIALADDRAVLHDDAAERPGRALACKLDCAPHELELHFGKRSSRGGRNSAVKTAAALGFCVKLTAMPSWSIARSRRRMSTAPKPFFFTSSVTYTSSFTF